MNLRYKKFFAAIILLSVAIEISSAQNFINGSFELNTGFCIINGGNATITSNVTSVNAYGCGNEIDLMINTTALDQLTPADGILL